jgi:hypothetical protein
VSPDRLVLQAYWKRHDVELRAMSSCSRLLLWMGAWRCFPGNNPVSYAANVEESFFEIIRFIANGDVMIFTLFSR